VLEIHEFQVQKIVDVDEQLHRAEPGFDHLAQAQIKALEVACPYVAAQERMRAVLNAEVFTSSSRIGPLHVKTLPVRHWPNGFNAPLLKACRLVYPR
jgi:hypothetical protein